MKSLRSRGRVVELAGLPGSGKSWAASRAGELGVALTEEAPESRSRLWYLARYPTTSVMGYLLVLTRRGSGIAHYKRAFQIARAAHIRHASPQENLVVDEGLTNALFIVCYGTGSTRASELITKHLLSRRSRDVDLFIVIVADPGQVRSNLAGRETVSSRFGSGTPEDSLRRLVADDTYPSLVKTLSQANAAKTRVVDSSSEALRALVRALDATH